MERLAFCEFTTMDTTFEEDLSLAREFGLSAIALCQAKIDQAGDDALELFRTSALGSASALPAHLSPLPTVPAGLYPGPTDPEERVELMAGCIDRLAPFQPDVIVFSTGADVGHTRAEAESIAVRAFRDLTAHAANVDVTLAIEPIRDVGFNASFLRTARETLAFLDKVGAPNLTLCFDVYHLWDEPEIHQLARAEGERIGSVQISDWHEPPRARGDRMIPGEGSIDLAALFEALEDGRYRGTYDVEIFSDDGRWGTPVPGSVWAMDPREVYRRCIDGFGQAWSAGPGKGE